MPRIEVTGDIWFSRPRPTQGSGTDYDDSDDDDDDDDNEDDEGYGDVEWTHLAPSSVKWWPLVTVTTHVAIPYLRGISGANIWNCALDLAG
jgi:hypothetical protein